MHYFETIKVQKQVAEKLEAILSIESGYCPDYGRTKTIATFTATFENGFEANIKVCNGDTPFVDNILFDEQGAPVDVPEISDTLLGTYEFNFEDNSYEVNVVVEDETSVYHCPKCKSENTETWLHNKEQNCLDCGHKFPLSEELAVELKSMKGIKTYVMIWQSEEEKWHYFVKDFDKNLFKNGYVDYYIEVEDGLIVSDTYASKNIGQLFNQSYDVRLWEK